MKVGIISFFDYDLYIKPKKKLKYMKAGIKLGKKFLN